MPETLQTPHALPSNLPATLESGALLSLKGMLRDAWLEKFKRLTTRYERQSRLYNAFWQLGCAMLLLEKLTG
jgi:hypothetical protein